MGDYAFDTDTRVWPAGADGEFAAELTDRWNGTAGAVWDSAGTLVAQSRQLALILPS